MPGLDDATMNPQKLRITLEQLRIAAKTQGRISNPCAEVIEKLTNALEAADYQVRPIHKYIKEAEKCYEEADIEDRKSGKASTLYYLSQYLDKNRKFKKK